MSKSDVVIPFYYDKHVKYIQKVSSDKDSFEYLVTQHLRMSGVYWGLTVAYLLNVNIKEELSFSGIVDWVMKCQNDETGG